MRKKSLVVKVWGSRLGSDIRILLKISFCLWAALGAASEVEVRNPQLTPGDDGYTLSADFAFEFNSRLEEAVFALG